MFLTNQDAGDKSREKTFPTAVENVFDQSACSMDDVGRVM
jgi:hypothetical protein